MYKYHVQYQALEKVNTMLPVPSDYPLKFGIDETFRSDFAQLTELAKTIYIDMAERPESYGLHLLPVTEKKGITDSLNSLRRPFDTLYALACSGQLENDALRVHVPTFKEIAKQAKPGKLTQYNMILDNFMELGFVFDGYNEKGFNKGQEYITMAFPTNPAVIRALKVYAACCTEYPKGLYGADASPYRRFALLDYKYTADLNKLPEIIWARDNVHYWDDESRAFFLAFYEQATKINKISWEGGSFKNDFFRGKKQVARIKHADKMHKFNVEYITNPEYRAIMKTVDGHSDVVLSLHLYLPTKGNNDRFDELPSHIIDYMKSKKCSNCNAFSAKKYRNGGKCPHTVYWVHKGEEQRGCSYHCFDFEQPKIEDIPAYVGLLQK